MACSRAIASATGAIHGARSDSRSGVPGTSS